MLAMVTTRGLWAHRRAVSIAMAVLTFVLAASNARATSVSYSTAPSLGSLSGVTLDGKAQTTVTLWNLNTNPFAITSSAPNNGWNLTVQGNGGAGSAVFKQYCPNATCGTDSGPGYVPGGFTLAANSLTINTSGAGWTGAAPKPTYQCNTSCNVDSASAVKIVSASNSVALATWTASGSASLSLSTPTTMHKLQTNEVYRVNLVWTLSSGP
jgi:hypothetical protein